MAFQSNHLVLSFLPSSLSITYISKVCGIGIFISPATSSYDDIISAVDDFFDHRDPNTAILMEEVCEQQGGRC